MSVEFAEVTVRGLLKMYGTTRALIGVDAVFTAGTVTVVEGQNGSGKSTLIQILAQLARPTRGEVHYGRLTRRQARPHIGLLGHSPLLYPDLDTRSNLAFFADLYSLDASRVEASIARFELGAIADRPVRTYSRGQQQRASLARALLPEPSLLLLDEPSTGLDVEGTARLEQIVAEERARGAIVVVVSHDSGFSERIADRVVRLHRGRLEPS